METNLRHSLEWTALLAIMLVLLMAVLAIVVNADGTGDDDSYKVGVDTTVSPAQYRRLYIPIYTEGNNTVLHFEARTVTTGQGNGLWWVEFMDNENMLLKLTDTTSYRVITAGSSTRAVSLYEFDIVISLEAGWNEGLYWIVVEKDFSGNEWCWISYSYNYQTDSPGAGGLILRKVEDLNETIMTLDADLTATQLSIIALEGRVRGVNASVIQLRVDLEQGLKNLQEALSLLNQSVYIGTDEAIALAVDVVRNDLQYLNDTFFLALGHLESLFDDLMDQMVVDLDYLTSRVNVLASNNYILEDDIAALEDDVDALRAALEDVDTNITDLEAEEPPVDSDAGVFAVGIIALALGVAGTAVAMRGKVE